jgi:hypothetical protein
MSNFRPINRDMNFLMPPSEAENESRLAGG